MPHPAPSPARRRLPAFACGVLAVAGAVGVVASRSLADPPGATGAGTAAAGAQPAAAASADPPATAPVPKVGRLPLVEFDVAARRVTVECEALAVDAPLEFFVCSAGTSEHEAALRTRAKPSHIHTALLAVGLKPGQPVTFVESAKKWLPPQGPPVHMTVEFERDGRRVSLPAYRCIRDVKTKKEPRAFTWIFAGSRVTPDGRYGADDTGYVATLVNFDYALIDVPELASSSNDLLEWERNAEVMPPKGTKVQLVIEPAGAAAPAARPTAPGAAAGPSPATQPATAPAADDAANGPPGLAEVRADEQKIKSMIDYHAKVMGPRQQALREAAEAHYKVIGELRKEQQRLINEADRIQRAIDELEKTWADSTTPRPEAEPAVEPPK